MIPIIKYKNNDNFGVTTIYYGHSDAALETIEFCLKEGLTKIAIENNYLEINIIDIDYSIDAFLVVSYSFIQK